MDNLIKFSSFTLRQSRFIFRVWFKDAMYYTNVDYSFGEFKVWFAGPWDEEKLGIIMQSTGLRDTNNRLIFEDDTFEGIDEMTGNIEYENGIWRVKNQKDDIGMISTAYLKDWYNHGEVIGNRFEGAESVAR